MRSGAGGATLGVVRNTQTDRAAPQQERRRRSGSAYSRSSDTSRSSKRSRFSDREGPDEILLQQSREAMVGVPPVVNQGEVVGGPGRQAGQAAIPVEVLAREGANQEQGVPPPSVRPYPLVVERALRGQRVIRTKKPSDFVPLLVPAQPPDPPSPKFSDMESTPENPPGDRACEDATQAPPSEESSGSSFESLCLREQWAGGMAKASVHPIAPPQRALILRAVAVMAEGDHRSRPAISRTVVSGPVLWDRELRFPDWRSGEIVIRGKTEGHTVNMLLDSGTGISLIRRSLLAPASLGRMRLAKGALKFIQADNSMFVCIGWVDLRLEIGERIVWQEFVVAGDLPEQVLLGRDFFGKHGVLLDATRGNQLRLRLGRAAVPVEHHLKQARQATELPKVLVTLPDAGDVEAPRDLSLQEEDELEDRSAALPASRSPSSSLPETQSPEIRRVLGDFADIFTSKPGMATGVAHRIVTTGPPVKCGIRQVALKIRDEIRRQIAEMLEAGVIVRSASPWLAPAVYVRKSSGGIRICVDYTELNKITVPDRYPLARADGVQELLQGATCFSTLDLRAGYWQIPLDLESQEKTAFSPGAGLGFFEFRRMPFGLRNAPASFQRFMEDALSDLDFVMVYLDDVLIFSRTPAEHVGHLRQTLERLRERGVTLNGEKCHIMCQQVKYLGNIFSAQGRAPDPEKIRAITKWPVPRNTKEVKGFLGLVGYYADFVDHLAERTAPLTDLLKKDKRWYFGEAEMEAFQSLKEYMTKVVMLAYPVPGMPYVVRTDASNTGTAGVLLQGDRPIAWTSHKLTQAESAYPTRDKECLAVVCAIKKFKHFLWGERFTLETDHQALVWLKAQEGDSRVGRWALLLQEFDFEIKHISAKLNGDADALSRVDWEQRALPPHGDGASPEGRIAVMRTAVEDAEGTRTLEIAPEISIAEIADAQLEDEELAAIRELLLEEGQGSVENRPKAGDQEERKFPSTWLKLWTQLVLRKGVLMRRWRRRIDQAPIEVLIIPREMKRRVMESVHDYPAMGHLGRDKMYDRLREQCYWLGMFEDVHEHCATCEACCTGKMRKAPPVPLTSMTASEPWQMVGVDVISLTETPRGRCCALVLQDYYTKWVEARALCDQKAETIVEVLIDWFSAWGFPQIFHSDQGANFQSHVMDETLRAFGVKRSRTTPYRPQADGQVERVNGTLVQMIRTSGKDKDWDQKLPLLLYAYRTSVQASTGCTPFGLMHGWEAHFPVLPLKELRRLEREVLSPRDYREQLCLRMAHVRELVEINLAAAAAEQKRGYDRRSSDRSLRGGEEVYLSLPFAGKLEDQWESGWTVMKELSPGVYKIVNPQGATKVVHLDRLKPRKLRRDGDPGTAAAPRQAPAIVETSVVGDGASPRTSVANGEGEPEGAPRGTPAPKAADTSQPPAGTAPLDFRGRPWAKPTHRYGLRELKDRPTGIRTGEWWTQADQDAHADA